MRYYLATTILSWYENQIWPRHFDPKGIRYFNFDSLWTQQDDPVVRKVNIPYFDYFHVCFSGLSDKWDMYFMFVQLEALIFLENVILLKVVVYLGEAIRRNYGSFDRQWKMSPTGRLIFHWIINVNKNKKRTKKIWNLTCDSTHGSWKEWTRTTSELVPEL